MKQILICLFMLISSGSSFAQNYYNHKMQGDSVYYNGYWYHRPTPDYEWNSKNGEWRKRAGKDSIWYNGKVVSKKYHDRVEFETYYMPGVGYSLHQFEGGDSIGNFSGVCVDYLLYGKSHQTDEFGPSHVKVYAKLNLSNSDKEGVSKMLNYGFGLQMSIEKNPKRMFMIPYFGFEVCGISQQKIGTTAAFYPIAGLYAICTKNLYLNLHAGYVYPVNNYDLLSGYYYQASLNFAMW